MRNYARSYLCWLIIAVILFAIAFAFGGAAIITEALRELSQQRMMVYGYSGFILIDKNRQPKVALHIENECRWAMKKYKTLHPDKPLPHITPHVYRHTFCTNMVNAGMDVKVLQYIMGHAEIDVTLNIYTHMGYERAAVHMLEVVDGKKDGGKTASGEM